MYWRRQILAAASMNLPLTSFAKLAIAIKYDRSGILCEINNVPLARPGLFKERPPVTIDPPRHIENLELWRVQSCLRS